MGHKLVFDFLSVAKKVRERSIFYLGVNFSPLDISIVHSRRRKQHRCHITPQSKKKCLIAELLSVKRLIQSNSLSMSIKINVPTTGRSHQLLHPPLARFCHLMYEPGNIHIMHFSNGGGFLLSKIRSALGVTLNEKGEINHIRSLLLLFLFLYTFALTKLQSDAC